MKLWVFSDLHLESCAYRLPDPQPDADVVVIAGDLLTPFTEAMRWIADELRGWEVIYVPGNHEWYAHKGALPMREEAEAARRIASGVRGLHVLTDEAVVIGGVRFLGATLWTDYALLGDAEDGMRIAGRYMNDHRLISTEWGSPFTPSDALGLHRKSRWWLEGALAQGHDGPTVVVTHHLPHPRSVAKQYAGDPLNGAFASDLSPLVEEGGAALWIHGHTHSSCDYLAGDTRVVCNPKGYGPHGVHPQPPENRDFDPSLVVEVA